MTPDARKYNPDPAHARTLIERIQATGKPQRWIAEGLGISERRVRYLIAGSRIVNGETLAVAMSYTEQLALECLADAAEVAALD
ncbi:hypothetical protein R69658_08016 [Paraburkholderia aspalathi]|uniref:Homeodomain-like domain-containing protein n=1 Tax=Paraburkholderia aspalathi TaxID=1324617 RepID=A0ABM8T8D6_9BURK|nr:hypothetical protein [Paraburkholderia aspalathi]MBK3824134.1 hypothetical protein [Paraburkholderia aspalathi]MBK3836305.1 hypothetical protein [Paraburkholderia aspalathi]MBK3865746.1 hypothetical protein [Paraburkholderia aspalathi]CAE6868667.1 hypothetical protein R69658_08016 [Paraburkholderia aspalathi]